MSLASHPAVCSTSAILPNTFQMHQRRHGRQCQSPDTVRSCYPAGPSRVLLCSRLHALSAGVDLISFSGILYSIYPPLFLALLVYSIGGTGTSLFLGRKLVGLNFQQEAQEANFRCGSHMRLQLLAQPEGSFETATAYRREAD